MKIFVKQLFISNKQASTAAPEPLLETVFGFSSLLQEQITMEKTAIKIIIRFIYILH